MINIKKQIIKSYLFFFLGISKLLSIKKHTMFFLLLKLNNKI